MKGYEVRIKTKDGQSHVMTCGMYAVSAWGEGDYRICLLDGKEPFPPNEIADVLMIPKEFETAKFNPEPEQKPPSENKWGVFDTFIGREWVASPYGVSLNRTACRRIASYLGFKNPREISDHLDKFEAEVLAKTLACGKISDSSNSETKPSKNNPEIYFTTLHECTAPPVDIEKLIRDGVAKYISKQKFLTHI